MRGLSIVIQLSTMTTLNRTAMAQKYKGKWVALRSDRKTVVVSGNSAKGVFESAKGKGMKNPIITHFPNLIRHFCGKIL